MVQMDIFVLKVRVKAPMAEKYNLLFANGAVSGILRVWKSTASVSYLEIKHDRLREWT